VSKRLLRRIWLPVGLGALVGLLLLVFSPAAGAQTPDSGQTAEATQVQATEILATPGGPTPTIEGTATPGPEVRTVMKITVDQAIQPIPKGDEFEVQVSVDNVEHLAGFSFKISYDPKRVEPVFVARQQQGGTAEQETPQGGVAEKTVKSANLGQFLTSSGRQEIVCGDPVVVGSTADVGCNLLGPPVCAGGQPGVSGTGLLGSLYFKSKGGGTTVLKLAESGLALDDLAAPCDISEEGDIQVIAIPHRRLDATIELAKNGRNTMLLIGIIVGVVAVVVVGGGAGYLWYRRRQGGSAS